MKRLLLVLGLAALTAMPSAAQVPVETRTMAIYDVAELLAAHDPEKPDSKPNAADLGEILRTALKLSEGSQIAVRDKALVIQASADEHRAITGFLQDLRRSMDREFEIRMRFVTVPKGAAPKSGDGRKVDAGPLGITLLSSDDVTFEAAEPETVDGPQIRCAPFQHCTMSVGTRKRLIREWRQETGVLDHPDGIFVPVIEEVFEGTALGYCVYPFRREGVDSVRLDLDIQVSWIDGEIRREYGLGGPVHRFESTTRRVESSVTLADGSSFLAGPFPAAPLVGPEHRGRDTYFLVTVSTAKSRNR